MRFGGGSWSKIPSQGLTKVPVFAKAQNGREFRTSLRSLRCRPSRLTSGVRGTRVGISRHVYRAAARRTRRAEVGRYRFREPSNRCQALCRQSGCRPVQDGGVAKSGAVSTSMQLRTCWHGIGKLLIGLPKTGFSRRTVAGLARNAASSHYGLRLSCAITSSRWSSALGSINGHASARMTMDVYTHAQMPAKRKAQQKVVEMVRSEVEPQISKKGA
jgi:hypothetical protein